MRRRVCRGRGINKFELLNFFSPTPITTDSHPWNHWTWTSETESRTPSASRDRSSSEWQEKWALCCSLCPTPRASYNQRDWPLAIANDLGTCRPWSRWFSNVSLFQLCPPTQNRWRNRQLTKVPYVWESHARNQISVHTCLNIFFLTYYCCHMSFGQVHHMNIITNPCAIRVVLIVSKDHHFWALTDSDLSDKGHQIIRDTYNTLKHVSAYELGHVHGAINGQGFILPAGNQHTPGPKDVYTRQHVPRGSSPIMPLAWAPIGLK